MFDIGEEYEFEIIKDDDGDGSLTLSIRKFQVRFVFPKPSRDQIALDPQNARLCQRETTEDSSEYSRLVFARRPNALASFPPHLPRLLTFIASRAPSRRLPFSTLCSLDA